MDFFRKVFSKSTKEDEESKKDERGESAKKLTKCGKLADNEKDSLYGHNSDEPGTSTDLNLRRVNKPKKHTKTKMSANLLAQHSHIKQTQTNCENITIISSSNYPQEVYEGRFKHNTAPTFNARTGATQNITFISRARTSSDSSVVHDEAPTFNARTGATRNMNVNTLLNAGNQKLSSDSSHVQVEEFQTCTAGRNRIIINTIARDDESAKEEKQVDVGYTTYFERSKEKVIVEYRTDRTFVPEDSSIRSFEPLTYDKLIDDIKDRRCKRLSIVGPAGYGKSTLIARLARDLSTVLNSEKLVVFLNFRDFKIVEKISPCELFFQSLNCDKSIIEDGYKWLVENQENVIFFLDGLDQFPDLVKSEASFLGQYSEGTTSEIISNMFAKRLFPDIEVVYTSREHAVSALDGDLRPDKVISITGLSSDNAKYLFSKKLENGEQHWDNMAPSLKPLLSIPAFLTFTKYAYEHDPNNPPSCLIEIIGNLFSYFDRSGHNPKKDILSPDEEKALGKLSYDGLNAGNVTFKKEDFTKVGLDWGRILRFVIFVPGYGRKNCYLVDGDRVAVFLHQTIQEFFAGKHIIHMGKKLFKNTVKQKLVDDYWSAVTRFVTGLLLNNKSKQKAAGISNCREKQEMLKKMLMSKYGSGNASESDVPSLLSTLASIAETEDSNFIQSFVKSISLDKYPVGISGMSSVASVIRHCKHLKVLELTHCSLGTDEVRLLWENVKGSGVKISSLDLSFNEFDANCCEIIGNIVTECSVDELRLSGCKITDAGLERFLATCKGAKISSLVFSANEFDANCCEIVGDIVTECSVDELILHSCRITDAGLERFLATCKEAKISSLRLNYNEFDANCCEIIGNIVTECSVDELILMNCKITDAGLERFLATCKGAKKFELDLSGNEFDANCCEIIGNIVTECSVDELLLTWCKITDAGLERFLATCKGTKLGMLGLEANYLSQSAIERIRESITVEKLYADNQWRIPSDTAYEDG